MPVALELNLQASTSFSSSSNSSHSQTSCNSKTPFSHNRRPSTTTPTDNHNPMTFLDSSLPNSHLRKPAVTIRGHQIGSRRSKPMHSSRCLPARTIHSLRDLDSNSLLRQRPISLLSTRCTNSRRQLSSTSQPNLTQLQIFKLPSSRSSNNKSFRIRNTLGSMHYLHLVKGRIHSVTWVIFESQLSTQLLAPSSTQREEALTGCGRRRREAILSFSSNSRGPDRHTVDLASKSRLRRVQQVGLVAALVSRTAIRSERGQDSHNTATA